MLATTLLLLGCGEPVMTRVRMRPRADRDATGITFLRYDSARADGFYEKDGRPCPAFNGELRGLFAGWGKGHSGDTVCLHDSFDHGAGPAVLEFRWRGTIPADGAFDVTTDGYSAAAWGFAQTRGSALAAFFTLVHLDLEVRSPHCQAERSVELVKIETFGQYYGLSRFYGYYTIPDTRLTGCVAGDPVELAFRLVGESNRGYIDVETFGFSPEERAELDRIFGLKRVILTIEFHPG